MIKIGTTSFGFRYSFIDPDDSPPLTTVLQQCRDAGVQRFKICENTRPLELSGADWRTVVRCASDLGMELQLGCKTLEPAVVFRYMDVAGQLGCGQVRIVMEEEDRRPTQDDIVRLFDAVVPRMQAAGMRLAVENHFDISSALLDRLAEPYPRDVVGYCIDTANSLRSFEAPLEVLRLLQPRVFCYHLKDYRVIGTKISFTVIGAPLGEGQLDLDGCLKMILAHNDSPQLFVETWTPPSDDRRKDIQTEADWLNRSVKSLLARLPS